MRRRGKGSAAGSLVRTAGLPYMCRRCGHGVASQGGWVSWRVGVGRRAKKEAAQDVPGAHPASNASGRWVGATHVEVRGRWVLGKAAPGSRQVRSGGGGSAMRSGVASRLVSRSVRLEERSIGQSPGSGGGRATGVCHQGAPSSPRMKTRVRSAAAAAALLSGLAARRQGGGALRSSPTGGGWVGRSRRPRRRPSARPRPPRRRAGRRHAPTVPSPSRAWAGSLGGGLSGHPRGPPRSGGLHGGGGLGRSRAAGSGGERRTCVRMVGGGNGHVHRQSCSAAGVPHPLSCCCHGAAECCYDQHAG